MKGHQRKVKIPDQFFFQTLFRLVGEFAACCGPDFLGETSGNKEPSPSPRLRRVPDLLQVLHTPSRQTQPTVGRPLWAGRIGMKRTFGCHGGLVVDVCQPLSASADTLRYLIALELAVICGAWSRGMLEAGRPGRHPAGDGRAVMSPADLFPSQLLPWPPIPRPRNVPSWPGLSEALAGDG